MAMRRRWMNSMAPMSTPRVGWPTSSTSGSRSISRASTIFCWLPPEKLAESQMRHPAGARRKPPSCRAQRRRWRRESRNSRADVSCSRLVAEDGVLAGREGRDEPVRCRSSGTCGELAHARRRRHRTASGLPSSRTAPAAGVPDAGERLEQLATGRCRRRRRCRRSRRRAR